MQVLTNQGRITSEELRVCVQNLEKWGQQPLGPRLVAKAWVDPAFKARLVADGQRAVLELDNSPGPYKPGGGAAGDASPVSATWQHCSSLLCVRACVRPCMQVHEDMSQGVSATHTRVVFAACMGLCLPWLCNISILTRVIALAPSLRFWSSSYAQFKFRGRPLHVF